ncbi:PAS domain S-box protein [Undibacterium sp. CY18W]|uniref:histidine kinase n=1 Tax=Undibacterium hunanense TaxID=2762292 RepID=A0ABR6ZSU6_9BURK|nr:PAS domain S-box protein [Undibacterium hunanense]MBC3918950.1 PAS domain S-box protein [Undibacterium hunanense]
MTDQARPLAGHQGHTLHQHFYQHSAQAHLAIAADGTVMQTNLAAGALFGIASRALLQQNLYPYFFDADAVTFDQVCRQIMLTGNTQQCELRVMRADRYPLLLQFSCERLDNEDSTQWISICLSDISKRQNPGMTLPEGEQLSRLIANNIPGMLGYWTNDLHCTFANQSYLSWFGRSIDQMRNVSMRDLFGPELFQKNIAYVNGVLNGMDQEFERSLIKANGDIGHLWTQYIAHKVDGVVLGFFALATDVTVLKRTQTALLESEKHYRTLAEDMPLFVSTFLPDGTLTYVNKLLVNSMASTRAKLLGKNFFDFLLPDNGTTVKTQLAALTHTQPFATHEHCYPASNGDHIYHRWTSQAFFNTHNELISFQAVGEDISAYKKAEKQLRVSANALKAISQGVIITDSNSIIRSVNSAFLTISGYTEAEVIGQSCKFLQGPETDQKTRSAIRFAIDNQTAFTGEILNFRKNGEAFWNELSISPVHDRSDDTADFIGVVRDISIRKQTEAALLDSEAKNSALLQAIPDLIFIIGHDGTYLDFHAPGPELMFDRPANFLHQKLPDVLPAHIANDFMRAINTALSSGTVQEIQYSLPGTSGKELIHEARIAPSNPDTVIAIIRDITDIERERRQHELQLNQRLQVSENDLRDIQQSLTLASDAANLGVWIRDLKRDEIWASPQWRAIFGFQPDQSLGIGDVLQRIHPADLNSMQQLTRNFHLHKQSRYQAEFRIRLENDKIRWISAIWQVEFDDKQNAKFSRGVVLDITSRKQAELELEQKRVEVTHLSRVATLGELSGALAHELNQPLTAILSNAQAAQRFLMRDDVDLNELREILKDIIDEDKRAGEIIHRLRQLFNKNETQTQAVDINALAVDVSRLLRNDMINRGVNLITEFNCMLPQVVADPVQLQQVLINLIINACDAMSDLDVRDKTIIVRTTDRKDGYVALSVIDQGPGIADTSILSVFDAFYTTKEKGMGLGLSICKNIIESNHGHIWCENNATAGASFHFRLLASDRQDTP